MFRDGDVAYRASDVRRSGAISCRMTRRLLKAAYGRGPGILRREYERDAEGNAVGRPTYWVRGGWRCGNGAGGAACYNAVRDRYNVIEAEGLDHGLATIASVR